MTTSFTADRSLSWCSTHEEPAWVFDDGSVMCMSDLILETSSSTHETSPLGTTDPATTIIDWVNDQLMNALVETPPTDLPMLNVPGGLRCSGVNSGEFGMIPTIHVWLMEFPEDCPSGTAGIYQWVKAAVGAVDFELTFRTPESQCVRYEPSS